VLHENRNRLRSATVELINSTPAADRPDTMPDVAAYQDFLDRWMQSGRRDADEADLHRIHRFRSQLRAIAETDDQSVRASIVNEVLAGAMIQPSLATHGDTPFHIHYFPSFASPAEHLIADIGMELAGLIESGEDLRLKVCASPTCSSAFFDTTKNHSRLYCDSQACGNRIHVANYRRRRTETG